MKLKEIDFKFTEEEGKKIFFTSDQHHYHKNIIRYCQRPFNNLDEMTEELIKRWNEVVPEDGIVFNLGDFIFGGSKVMRDIVGRLNGKQYFIYGNHDYGVSTDVLDELFEWHGKSAKIMIGHHKIYLQHFPYLCFDGAWNGEKATWQLYGHCHSKKGSMGIDVQRLANCFPTQYDVGVDNNNYYPVSFENVKEIIKDQQYSLNLIKEV